MSNIQAFPRPFSKNQHGESRPAQEGMSLRDYFAAHAPPVPSDFPTAQTGEKAVPDRFGRMERKPCYESRSARMVRWRWYYADMMVKAREA